ncbi:MAG: glycosyltransferase family 2 protein [Gammaproteobacteria bacterium]|nr:glycosyltransferase family 2 protein [Gammaproteobacteria bacterium]
MKQPAYAIVMFAYNEEDNIQRSLDSVFSNVDDGLTTLTVMANGCTDRTAEIVRKNIERFSAQRLQLVELSLGDKCNAWNHYVHQLADMETCCFFIDADVAFSSACFSQMSAHLNNADPSYHVVAGLPLSGRNRDYYETLVVERACFFGNLYGLRGSYLKLLRQAQFHLPVGLNWIDSFLTKAANTDLKFGSENLPNRVTYLPQVGYYVDSLSPFRASDIKLYRNRIARYELGKIQERYLDALPLSQWPKTLEPINRQIWENFPQQTQALNLIKRWLVRGRLKKLVG